MRLAETKDKLLRLLEATPVAGTPYMLCNFVPGDVRGAWQRQAIVRCDRLSWDVTTMLRPASQTRKQRI